MSQSVIRVNSFHDIDSIFCINFERYDVIEFSYGGFKIDTFINYMFDQGDTTDVFDCIFCLENLKYKKLIGTSAGAILLGLVLLDIYSEFTIHDNIMTVVHWFRSSVQESDFIPHYFSLGVAQKTLLAVLKENIPQSLLQLTLNDLAKKIPLGYIPELMYFELPQRLKACEATCSIFDAMKRSSDVFGVNDGGISQILPGYSPIYRHHRAIVFSVCEEYRSVCTKFDVVLLL